jgi:hypothetical protein
MPEGVLGPIVALAAVGLGILALYGLRVRDRRRKP